MGSGGLECLNESPIPYSYSGAAHLDNGSPLLDLSTVNYDNSRPTMKKGGYRGGRGGRGGGGGTYRPRNAAGRQANNQNYQEHQPYFFNVSHFGAQEDTYQRGKKGKVVTGLIQDFSNNNCAAAGQDLF